MINLCIMPKKFGFKSSSCGSRKKTVYKYVYDERYGCPRRVANGEIDVHEMIQAYSDDVDFKAIGKMLVDTRDNVKSHFTDINGEVIDVTGQPRNIHEYEALHDKMMSQFDALPADLKALFGGSFDGYRKAYADGSMVSIFETYGKSLEIDNKSTEGGNE